MIERRRHYRTECRVPACLEQRGFIKSHRFCRTANVGMKGVFMTHPPCHPVGTKCKLILQDHSNVPLKLAATVTHASDKGVGYTFIKPKIDDCLRLKHLVKPYWDGEDYLQGVMLMMRYSKPSSELKDMLSITKMMDDPSDLFASVPHTKSSCGFL